MAIKMLHDGELRILDYRCESGPGDVPFTEVQERYSLSYVRRGSFGCRTLGRDFELITGAFLLGCPDDDYLCTHDHHDCGDECLSIQLAPELWDALGGKRKTWRIGALPPLADIAVVAELAQAAASGATDIGVDEAGLALAVRFMRAGSDGPPPSRKLPGAHLRRIIVNVADWIALHSEEPIGLRQAATQAGLSSYHFLRTFRQVLGLTPHQYLIRCRLRRAARWLLEDDATPITTVALGVGFEDISNFVRSFHRAAGCSPRGYRALASSGRNIYQEVMERICFTPPTR